MQQSNVIPLGPALARQRRAMAGVSLASWHNSFPDGVEDLWAGPFVRESVSEVVPLRQA